MPKVISYIEQVHVFNVSGCSRNMDPWKCTSSVGVPSLDTATCKFPSKTADKTQLDAIERASSPHSVETEVHVDLREVYLLILHFLSSGPCKKTFSHFLDELMEHQLLPRRYHAWFSRSGVCCEDDDDGDGGVSFPLTYANLVERYACFSIVLSSMCYNIKTCFCKFCG